MRIVIVFLAHEGYDVLFRTFETVRSVILEILGTHIKLRYT